ncbi:MAG TPA: BadF/BadG/BcrA/BcrD ATPase family protein [Ignavibacteria bacterium]|nr:BadF/BadG/BcrA/BcrD ATPase family protein [Ignavibacteria bacterium]HMR42067.1 BadF/BadG/BcrA/BcrD ATPase family protein [Ignavibacteria bacterium]
MKKSIGYYSGIDSGGTKCEIIITDLDKKVIYLNSFKGIHYSVAGVRLYTDTVSDYLIRAFKKCNIDLKECKGIGIGIAGAREESDRKKLQTAFRKKLDFRNIHIHTDAMTALYGAFEGEDGIILISGTGSVLYGLVKGKITRVGGWGRIIGDEGGGYWIGKRALNLLGKEFDKGNETLLAKNLKEEFGIDRNNLNDRIFHQNFDIQKITPVVIRSAEKGCKLSLQVVSEAVKDLTEHIRTFLSITGVRKKICVAFIGSVIENKNFLSDQLSEELKKLKNVEVVIKKHKPSFGAVLLASENSTRKK